MHKTILWKNKAIPAMLEFEWLSTFFSSDTNDELRPEYGFNNVK